MNKALLKEAGYEVTDITNFESLKKIADDIHSRAAELGFDAFTSAGLDGTSSWRFSGHLANMPLFYEFRDEGVTSKPATIKGTYLDNYKAIWDLYTTDSATTGAALLSATGDQAEAEFGEGKAVFYQNGTWEYSNLTGEKFGMNADDLTMIPIYCGIEGEEKARPVHRYRELLVRQQERLRGGHQGHSGLPELGRYLRGRHCHDG